MSRRILAIVAAVAVGMAGCNRVDDSLADPPNDSEPRTTDRTSSEVADPIEWEDCGGIECATVDAPVDYGDPDGDQIELLVSRVPATGERRGALWMNFGGPGAAAATSIASWPVPDEISEHFDIIGMDPRGVGGSSALACGIPATELYAADPTIDEPSDVDDLLDVSQRFVDDCEHNAGDLLPHLGTRNVARDMDLIRSRMGDDSINFLGFSYGTSIGQAYAEEFPDRVRTMVLDGIVDPALTGTELAVGQAAGFENTLQRWAESCDQRSCTLDDPVAAVDQFLILAEGGIPASGGETVGPGEASIAIAYPMYAATLWSTLDAALDDALSMDGTAMARLAEAYAALVDFSIYFAVSCLDSQWPDSPDEVLAAAEQAAVAFPRFGEAIVNDYIRCAMWPAESDPLGPISAPGAPPILVVSTTGDAATPHENGVAVAQRLESARLLTHEGDSHTIVFQGSDCVDDLVVDYIVDEKLPSQDVTC